MPVVLGHSFLCNGNMWRAQVRAFESKYRLINIDFRGHGRSAVVRKPFTLYDAGEERVLQKLKHRLMGFGTRAFGTGPFLSPICKMMFGTTTLRENSALVEEWRQIFAEMDVPSALHGLDALVGRDSVVSRLPEISVPSLVAVGQEDVSLPPALSHQIHDGVPDSHLVEIPGAGHLSTLEQPDRVNEALEMFFRQIQDCCNE